MCDRCAIWVLEGVVRLRVEPAKCRTCSNGGGVQNGCDPPGRQRAARGAQQRPAMKTLRTLSLFVVFLVAACKEQPAAAPVVAVTAVVAAAPVAAAPVDNAAVAKEMFATRCTPCHGPSGAGDGPASAGLTPKPANFASDAWQTSVTDEHIEKIVMYGGMAVGKSAAMPPNPDLGSKPEVVKALREYLRALKK